MKRALVTGAASGIGRATAALLAADGWQVIALDRNPGPIAQLAAETPGVEALPFDLARLSQGERPEVSGELHGVVHCAGVFAPYDAAADGLEGWRRVLEINLEAPLLLNQHLLANLEATGGGAIVHVTSVHQFVSELHSAHYDAAKGGLGALTRTLAIEYAPRGVRVNAVAPGFVNTAMSVVDGVNELETEAFRAFYVRQRKIPLARCAEPAELAGPIAFLLSERASYITGATLIVDGGLTVTF